MDAYHFSSTNEVAADGEGVWSWHPWAGAKSRGMATSALRARRAETREATVTNKVMDTEESAQQALTPSRREGRVFRLNLW
jgi:hypothetical protein